MTKLIDYNEKGFTLIELMVVIAIIGILAAIAIPQFIVYRNKSYTAAMESDAHNLANAQEVYFTDNGTYSSNTSPLLNATYGADDLSEYTTIVAWGGNVSAFSFRLDDSTHSGVMTIFYDNSAGGLQ